MDVVQSNLAQSLSLRTNLNTYLPFNDKVIEADPEMDHNISGVLCTYIDTYIHTYIHTITPNKKED